jgi:ribonuclease P protein component
MLPTINRLKKKKDFERVFKKGKSFKKDFLSIRISQNNLNKIRFGFIVSQKISKKAFVRNKIKRRLREIVRKNLSDIYLVKSRFAKGEAGVSPKAKQFNQVKKGIDVVIIALPGLENKDFLEIQEMVDNLFKKAGLIDK